MDLKKQIFRLRNFIPLIRIESNRVGIDPYLLLSLAVLEDINRPSWFRALEKLIFKTGFYKPKTFGLMQVSSNKPVSDKESIRLAALLIKNILKETKNINKVGIKYNGSIEYGDCLLFIYNNLKRSLFKYGKNIYTK